MLGKLILLIITILIAMKNNICGLLMAVFVIIILEYNYEGFENLDTNKNKNKKKLKSKSRPKKKEDDD
tara:strand:- start:1211 stop:1414 length:204 start_codon:yes stop_codon:yes gene_type:complete